MDIKESFNNNFIDFQNYYNKPVYILQCIFCSSVHVIPLTTDGGSMQQCQQCRKTYQGKISSEPIQNFSNSVAAAKNPLMLFRSPRKKT